MLLQCKHVVLFVFSDCTCRSDVTSVCFSDKGTGSTMQIYSVTVINRCFKRVLSSLNHTSNTQKKLDDMIIAIVSLQGEWLSCCEFSQTAELFVESSPGLPVFPVELTVIPHSSRGRRGSAMELNVKCLINICFPVVIGLSLWKILDRVSRKSTEPTSVTKGPKI